MKLLSSMLCWIFALNYHRSHWWAHVHQDSEFRWNHLWVKASRSHLVSWVQAGARRSPGQRESRSKVSHFCFFPSRLFSTMTPLDLPLTVNFNDTQSSTCLFSHFLIIFFRPRSWQTTPKNWQSPWFAEGDSITTTTIYGILQKRASLVWWNRVLKRRYDNSTKHFQKQIKKQVERVKWLPFSIQAFQNANNSSRYFTMSSSSMLMKPLNISPSEIWPATSVGCVDKAVAALNLPGTLRHTMNGAQAGSRSEIGLAHTDPSAKISDENCTSSFLQLQTWRCQLANISAVMARTDRRLWLNDWVKKKSCGQKTNSISSSRSMFRWRYIWYWDPPTGPDIYHATWWE